MSKEYKLYRVLTMIYVLTIGNILLFIFEGLSYYLCFLSSIILLFTLLINERMKVYNLIKWPKHFKISREWIYLLVFFICYYRHYQPYRHLNYAFVAILQLMNVLLFVLLFCVKEKDSKSVSTKVDDISSSIK